MPSKRRIKFSCSTWKEIPVLTELKFHRVDVSALKLLLTAAQNVTEYSELEFFQLHLWAGSLGEPGVAPDPKIHKTWDLPNSHFPPQIHSPRAVQLPAGQAATGGMPGRVKASRESQIPLSWLCRRCFPGCFQEEPRQPPSRWQQPCTRRCICRIYGCLSCRAQPEPPSDLAGPKHEFPELKIPIWGIYGAPRQPLQGTGSASPPAHMKLNISMPIPAQSQRFHGLFSFLESPPSHSALPRWGFTCPRSRAEGQSPHPRARHRGIPVVLG